MFYLNYGNTLFNICAVFSYAINNIPLTGIALIAVIVHPLYNPIKPFFLYKYLNASKNFLFFKFISVCIFDLTVSIEKGIVQYANPLKIY